MSFLFYILINAIFIIILGLHSRNYAAAAGSLVHTKCKIVNGVYVVTLDSPNTKVNLSYDNIPSKWPNYSNQTINS